MVCLVLKQLCGAMQYSILMIEDDEFLAQQVGRFLEQSGYQVNLVFDGQQALASFNTNAPDLILLDWMLPEISGIDLCREIRKTSTVPIIMLTAKGEESDKIIGLELGADDYMTKPYSLKELLARIRRILRRVTEAEQQVAPIETERLKFPHFELDESTHRLIVNGQPLETTRSEFDLLRLFCRQPGRVFSRDDLLSHISGKEHGAFDRSVDMHISNLRKKIEPAPKKPVYLKTVWGVGYRFEIPT